MLVIDDEKLPPPNPAVAAHARRIQNCVSWLWWASQPLGRMIATSATGMNSSDALIPVHSRPPNLGTAKVYGRRSPEPIRLGNAVSQNDSGSDSTIPMLARLITMIVHSTQ